MFEIELSLKVTTVVDYILMDEYKWVFIIMSFNTILVFYNPLPWRIELATANFSFFYTVLLGF